MFRFLFNSNAQPRLAAVLCSRHARAGFASLQLAPTRKRRPIRPHSPRSGPRKFAFDPTKLVWPSPPSIARVRWVDYFAGAKIDYTSGGQRQAKAELDGPAGGRPVG